jgi:hypothetical protein
MVERPWCKGSTRASKPLSVGSSPTGRANLGQGKGIKDPYVTIRKGTSYPYLDPQLRSQQGQQEPQE